MSKVKIPVIGTVGKTIVFDPDATVGATLGVDMFLPDGTILTLAKLAELLSAADETARAASGNSIFVGSVFLRKGSAPTEPIDDDGQYNFTTGVLTPPSTGGGSDDDWSITVPAGTDPLYVSQGSFEVAGATGIDLTVDWTAPVILASDGATGATGATGGDGNSIFVAQVFLRKGSAPTKPIDDDGQYNFTTGVLTPPSTGGGSADDWSITVPAGTDPLYVVAGSFEINGVTGTDSTVVWSTPQILASDGTDGADGEFRDIKFQRSAATPATPTGDNPAGWIDGVPDGLDTLWQIVGSKTAAGVLIGVWSDPERIQGLVYRGAYAAGTAYILHDVVTFQERSYICVLATTGNAPSGTNAGNTQWDLLAGKGDTGDPPTVFTETIVITGTGPVNLRTLANDAGYDGIADATITFTQANGVNIQGNANGGDGLVTGSWPSSPTIALTLQISGRIRGGGGKGGKGGAGNNGGNGSAGAGGGDAISLEEPMTGGITVNSGGLLQAAGGGAGGGGGYDTGLPEPLFWGGGGGGGGRPNGGGGNAGSGSGGAAGAAGTSGGGGAGGGGGDTAGDGGNGGTWAANGQAGDDATGSFGSGGGLGNGGSAAAAGHAIRKNGNSATVTNNGTITGTISS